MALNLPTKGATIKVIVSADSALDVTPEEYAAYQEHLDESLLKFKPGEEPTRFVMRKVLKWDQAKSVKNQAVRYKDGEIFVQPSYMMEEVRAALVDIVNPPNLHPDQMIEFKRDGDGGASKDLVESLEAIGALNDLFTARQKQTTKISETVKKS